MSDLQWYWQAGQGGNSFVAKVGIVNVRDHASPKGQRQYPLLLGILRMLSLKHRIQDKHTLMDNVSLPNQLSYGRAGHLCNFLRFLNNSYCCCAWRHQGMSSDALLR